MHYVRRPEWLKLSPLSPEKLAAVRHLSHDLKLHTVCESSRCPNRPDCFSSGTATFMLLGDVCTRNCAFCAVSHGMTQPPDPSEPENVVRAIAELGLKYVVLTSVTRDDLEDGGATHFARTTAAIKKYDPAIVTELLIPDFRGSSDAVRTVLSAPPDVINHNLETVPRLYSAVRPQASYRRSLKLLESVKIFNDRLLTKSGFMLGLGEQKHEVIDLMADLRDANCDLLTIGQYLQPSLKHHPLVRYVSLQEFEQYRETGLKMGFAQVASGPLVRSSFHAEEMYRMTTPEP
jgi:lipoyl synthase